MKSGRASARTQAQYNGTWQRADLHAYGDLGMVQNARFRLKEYIANYCDASG